MQKWQFGQNTDRRWYWRRLNDDSNYVESSRTFRSRLDCIADAYENGYLSPQTDQTIFAPPRAESSDATPADRWIR
jgi:hypothetical protein